MNIPILAIRIIKALADVIESELRNKENKGGE